MKEKHMKKYSRFKKTAALAAALVVLAGWVGGLVYAATTTSGVKVTSQVFVTATGAPAQGALTWSMDSAATKTISFTNGSGATAINKVYVAHLTATTTIDLDSTLTDPAGSSISFARIAYVRVIPGSANAAAGSIGGDWLVTKYLVAGGDTLSAVTLPLNKTGFFEFAAPDATGIAVTATTGDGLTITLSGSDTADVVVLGS